MCRSRPLSFSMNERTHKPINALSFLLHTIYPCNCVHHQRCIHTPNARDPRPVHPTPYSAARSVALVSACSPDTEHTCAKSRRPPLFYMVVLFRASKKARPTEDVFFPTLSPPGSIWNKKCSLFMPHWQAARSPERNPLPCFRCPPAVHHTRVSAATAARARSWSRSKRSLQIHQCSRAFFRLRRYQRSSDFFCAASTPHLWEQFVIFFFSRR